MIVGACVAIWLKAFATVLLVCVVPSLYSVVFCTCVEWVCLVCLLLCKDLLLCLCNGDHQYDVIATVS